MFDILNHMKLIILNGSSCSGKSSVIKNIMMEKDGLFHLSYDRIKWSFSKYDRNKYYKDVREIIFAVAESVFKMGHNVISDSTLYRDTKIKLIDLAFKYKYQVIEINLEASYEVLLSRFNERIADSKIHPERKISNLSKDRFKELFDIFNNEKDPSAITFNTDKQTVEEVTKEISKFI